MQTLASLEGRLRCGDNGAQEAESQVTAEKLTRASRFPAVASRYLTLRLRAIHLQSGRLFQGNPSVMHNGKRLSARSFRSPGGCASRCFRTSDVFPVTGVTVRGIFKRGLDAERFPSGLPVAVSRLRVFKGAFGVADVREKCVYGFRTFT